MAVVVFPTPPFWFAIAMTFDSSIFDLGSKFTLKS
jgi:hypothetical protein